MKGSLLVTKNELETNQIPPNNRDDVIVGFYLMKTEAERHGDRFYTTKDVYEHPFSYGTFYPEFINLSWRDFQAFDSLKGISQKTYELMLSFCQCTGFTTLATDLEFSTKEVPHARSGYSNPMMVDCFVNDLNGWEEWHREWYASHQEQIDWNDSPNNWLPRIDLINKILRRELVSCLGEEEVERISEGTIVNVFYNHVMKHKGAETHAYAKKIGSEVCLCNYYVFEHELSSLEHQASGSLRAIFSIINREGQRQFISIDFKHGMFEFLDRKGKHVGEFRFDGSPNSGEEEDHSLRCLHEWHKQTGK